MSAASLISFKPLNTFFAFFDISFLISVILDIEVACYGYEGIDAVKEALRAGLNCSTETMPIKVSSPFSLSLLKYQPKPNQIFFIILFYNKC